MKIESKVMIELHEIRAENYEKIGNLTSPEWIEKIKNESFEFCKKYGFSIVNGKLVTN